MASIAPFAPASTAAAVSVPAPVFPSVRRRPRMGVVLHDFALGGTERIAVRLANEWVRLGVEVELFCGAPMGPMRELLDADVIVRGPREPIRRGRGSLRRLGEAARAYFAQAPVDAVYIPGNTHWPVAAPLADLPATVRPQIIAQISAALEKPQRGALRQRLFEARMRRRLRGVDQVVGLCRPAARQAARMLGRDDIQVIPLPALSEERERVRGAVTGSAPVILAASRLVAGKGVEHLVRAFAGVEHPSARLVIVGSGPMEAEIRQLITRLGLSDRVDLPGYVTDVRPWLNRASFLAMPSEHEGYPAVIVEALAAGRPVLATDCSPAVQELLGDEAAGLVVPICDVRALARGIDAMLARPPTDPQALAARVERFRIGPVARRYLSLVGIAPGYNDQPARLLIAANDGRLSASDCVAGAAAL